MKPLGRIGSSWVGSGGLGGIHVQQVQQSGLQWWGLGDDRWVVAAGGDEPQAGQGLEDEPPGGFGRLADVQPLEEDGGGDSAPNLAFDQAEDEQRQADHGDQGLDAPVGLHEQGATASGPLKLP